MKACLASYEHGLVYAFEMQGHPVYNAEQKCSYLNWNTKCNCFLRVILPTQEFHILQDTPAGLVRNLRLWHPHPVIQELVEKL
jgi:hypothetical protein